MAFPAALDGEIFKLLPNDLEIYTERDNTRRHRARKFALNVVVSAYQAFITGSAELQKDNVIATQLMESNALDSSEKEIAAQFSSYSKYLESYAALDDEITRVYRPAQVALEDVPEEDAVEQIKVPDIHGGGYANWLATENVMMTFFAAITQFANSDAKRDRVDHAIANLIASARSSGEKEDPLGLEVFEKLRAGNNPRRINVGLATRRLLTNGFKEFFRDSGETALSDCWPLGAD